MQGDLKYQLNQDILKNEKYPFSCIEKAHNNSIESLVAHPSGTFFASGSHDHLIKIWDAEKLQERKTLTSHKQGVWSIDYSNDGKMLLSASPDKSILLWNENQNSPTHTFLAHKNKIYTAKFNETNKLFASIGEAGELMIWDIAKPNTPIKTLSLKCAVGYDVEWSNNGEYLFTTSAGGKLSVFDAQTFQPVQEDTFLNISDMKMESCSTNWQQFPGRIFSCSDEGHIIWYTMRDAILRKQTSFMGHIDGCRSVNIHPQNYLLSTGKNGTVRLWDCFQMGKPKIQSNLILHQENVTSSVFLGEELIVTGSWDQNIGVWKLQDLLN